MPANFREPVASRLCRGDKAVGPAIGPAAFFSRMSPNPNWQQSGFPPQHADAVRGAWRYAIVAMTSTGTLFGILLVGTIFAVVPPSATAFAGAIFLLFGLWGGFARIVDTTRYARLVPYFKHPLGDIDTYLRGCGLARSLAQLDATAEELRVNPLSRFGFNDDLRGEQLVWHPAADGLRTVAALLQHLELHSESVPDLVLSDLRAWRDVLEKAAAMNTPFCILLMHGNTTSGQEWEVRKGTAF